MNNQEPSDIRITSVRLPSKEKDMTKISLSHFCQRNMDLDCFLPGYYTVTKIFPKPNISAILFYSSKTRCLQLDFHTSSAIPENTLYIL